MASSGQPNRLEIILSAQTSQAQQDLQRFQQAAQQTGQGIQQGLTGPLQAAAGAQQHFTQTTTTASQTTQAFVVQLGEVIEHVKQLGESHDLEPVKEALEQLREKVSEFAHEIESAGVHAIDLQRSLSGAFADPSQLQVVTNTVHELGVKFAGVISEEQLGAVAKRLQTFGQYSAETMERAANVSAATGASIDEVANALTRFASGDQRAAMMLEHQLNVKPDELKAFGAALDQQGKVLMDTAEHAKAAGEALQKLFDSKYADAAARMADPVKQMSAALEELRGKMGQDMAAAEADFAKGFLPIIEYLEKLPPSVLAFAGGSAIVTDKLVSLGSTALQTTTQVAQLVNAWPALKGAMESLGPTLSKLAPNLSGVSNGLAAMGPYGIAAAAILVTVGIGLAYAAEETRKMAAAQAESNRIQEDGQKLWTKQAALYAMSAQEAAAAGKTTRDYTEAIIGLHAEMDRKRGAGQDTSQDEATMRGLIQARGDLAAADQKTAEAEQSVVRSLTEVEHAYKTGRASLDDLIAAQERQVESLRKQASVAVDGEHSQELLKQANEVEEQLYDTQKKRLDLQLNGAKEAAAAGQSSFADLVAAHQTYIQSLQAMGASEAEVNKAKLALFQLEKQAAEETAHARAEAEDWLLQHTMSVEERRQQVIREGNEDASADATRTAQAQVDADQRAVDLAKARHQDATELEKKASADRVALAQAEAAAKQQASQDEVSGARESAHVALEAAQQKYDLAKKQLQADEQAGRVGSGSQEEQKRLQELAQLHQHLVDVRTAGAEKVAEADRKATNEEKATQADLTSKTLSEDEKRTEAQIQHAHDVAEANKQAAATIAGIQKDLSQQVVDAYKAKQQAGTATGADAQAAASAIQQQADAEKDAQLKALDEQQKNAKDQGNLTTEQTRAFADKRLQIQADALQKEQQALQQAGLAQTAVAQQVALQTAEAFQKLAEAMHLDPGQMQLLVDGAKQVAQHLGTAADHAERMNDALNSSPLMSLQDMAASMSFIGGFGSGVGDQSAFQPNYMPPSSSQPDLGQSKRDGRKAQVDNYGTTVTPP